jgi:hypothetical protein
MKREEYKDIWVEIKASQWGMLFLLQLQPC